MRTHNQSLRIHEMFGAIPNSAKTRFSKAMRGFVYQRIIANARFHPAYFWKLDLAQEHYLRVHVPDYMTLVNFPFSIWLSFDRSGGLAV